MSILKEMEAHRAKLVAFAENHTEQSEAVISKFETECASLVSTLRAGSKAADTGMKNLISEQYGEADREEVDLAKNVIEAEVTAGQEAPVDVAADDASGEAVPAAYTVN